MDSYIIFFPIVLSLANFTISYCYMARTNMNIRNLEQSLINMYTLIQSSHRQVYIAPQATAPPIPPGYGYAYSHEDPNNQGISGLNVV
jgi:hypothetical protein